MTDLPYSAWPRDMNPKLCLTCVNATLTPAGIHVCLVHSASKSWTTEPQCVQYTEGQPKLLTYQEIMESNNTSGSKVKTKKQKGMV